MAHDDHDDHDDHGDHDDNDNHVIDFDDDLICVCVQIQFLKAAMKGKVGLSI